MGKAPVLIKINSNKDRFLLLQSFPVCRGIFPRQLAYSLGLGIPFLLSAVLIDYLKSAFQWIKQHYRVINTVCGLLLVLLGVLMATGMLGRLLALLS